jgi:hypothetical protein
VDPVGYLDDTRAEFRTAPAWGYEAEDAETAAARDAAVQAALRPLRDLLARAARPPRAHGGDPDRAHALLVAAIERAINGDPNDPSFITVNQQVRSTRSIIARRRYAKGVPVAQQAAELGVKPQRVRQLMENNRRYLSADRRLALQALREESHAIRAAARARADRDAAERAAAREASAAAQRMAREAAQAERRVDDLTLGRRLMAQVDAGRRPADLATEGLSWQRVAALVRMARAEAAQAASA